MIPVDSRDPTLTDPELTEIVLHHAREQGVTLTEQQIKVSRERAPNIERLAIVRAGNITGAGLSNASVTIELLRSQGRVAMAFWHNENGGDASALLAVFRMDAEQSRVLARMIEGRI